VFFLDKAQIKLAGLGVQRLLLGRGRRQALNRRQGGQRGRGSSARPPVIPQMKPPMSCRMNSMPMAAGLLRTPVRLQLRSERREQHRSRYLWWQPSCGFPRQREGSPFHQQIQSAPVVSMAA